jgi:hypothetical protein
LPRRKLRDTPLLRRERPLPLGQLFAGFHGLAPPPLDRPRQLGDDLLAAGQLGLSRRKLLRQRLSPQHGQW